MAASARTRRGAVAAALGSLLLVACALSGEGPAAPGLDTGATAQTADPAAKRGGVKVAMLLPLSAAGQTAAIAKAMKQAGELALFEMDNPNFQLIVKDDKGTADGARAAAQEAVKEGAELILGPLLSASVKAATPVAREGNVSLIAFSNDRHVAGRGVYLMSFLAEQEVDRVVGFAVAQGKTRFAALVAEDAYGKIAEAAFTRAVARVQGSVVAIERYAGTASGMLEPVKRLTEAIKRADEEGQPVEALFVPGGIETLPNIAPLLTYSKLDTQRIKLLGTGGWDYSNLGRSAPFVGGWFPAPDPRGWRGFAERFAKTFGSPPPRIASLAFDAVSVAIDLAKGSQGARFGAANLTRASGFTGIDGPVRLLADGTPERALAILEVQSFGANVIDPAPGTFGSAQMSAVPFRLN